MTLTSMRHNFLASSGMHLHFVFAHSSAGMGVAKKSSLVSADMKHALLWVSWIVPLIKIFVLSDFATDAAASCSHVDLSPPTVTLTMCFSCFGRM